MLQKFSTLFTAFSLFVLLVGPIDVSPGLNSDCGEIGSGQCTGSLEQ